nr:MAG TPA: hypothetical protein [Caudoviricetes sp.]
MADKTVGELPRASTVTTTDLFVMEQAGQAKSLTVGGQNSRRASESINRNNDRPVCNGAGGSGKVPDRTGAYQ